MKIASAYSLLFASLCVLPSAHAAVRGRSLVRGAPARTINHRRLEDESKDGEAEDDEVEIEDEESPIAPKKRDCKTSK